MRQINSLVPAYLLTGFLGSGKTTLLNAALRSPALANTAVVVNELGEIGLDQLVVAQASDNVVLLDAGCLCCVNTGALHETLADLLGRRARGEVPRFERVVIETSGAADPAPLLHILLGHPLLTADFRLAAVVCTVDAQHFATARTEHPELDRQVAMADRIVITKRDLADPTAAIAGVEAINPHAVQVSDPAAAFTGHATPRHRTAGIDKLGPIRAHARPGSLRAFAFRPPSASWPGWAAWTRLASERFGARLLRVKGLLRMEGSGEIVLVQGVQGVFHPPQRFRDWPDADHGNRLVCIAADIDEAELRKTLEVL
ncbi:MAG TPA: GTP-binding protein [Burkholderiales bacterium]|nr:GTP-binding protein [Burkholderiales bacterium]